MPDILLFKQSIKAFELIAAIAAFANWHKWKTSYWKWFPVYLLVLFLIECTGNILAYLQFYKANGNLYKYFGLPLEFLFFCWFYYNCFNKKLKPLSIYCAALFILSWIIESFFIHERSAYFSSLSYCTGNVVIVIMVLAYTLNLSFSDAILQYRTNPAFWISIGLLIFYLGTFPYYGLFNLLAQKYMHMHEMYTWVMIFLNYTMYLIFAGVFIWSKPK